MGRICSSVIVSSTVMQQIVLTTSERFLTAAVVAMVKPDTFSTCASADQPGNWDRRTCRREHRGWARKA
eukprot:3560358-Prymnesium_polylepis.1